MLQQPTWFNSITVTYTETQSLVRHLCQAAPWSLWLTGPQVSELLHLDSISPPPDLPFLPAHVPQGGTAASCMRSCYTETEDTFRLLALQCYKTCSLSGRLKNTMNTECVASGFLDLRAHLKAMFLPSPLLCSVFLRLRDRLGMRAWTTAGSKTATVSRTLYTCLS